VGAVLGWPPVVWALRIALVVTLAGCSYVYLLLIAPFFRPANIRRMVRADLPRVRSLGAEFAGTRGAVEFMQEQGTTGLDTRATHVSRKEGVDAPQREEDAG
jgi:hypothetical protein